MEGVVIHKNGYTIYDMTRQTYYPTQNPYRKNEVIGAPVCQ